MINQLIYKKKKKTYNHRAPFSLLTASFQGWKFVLLGQYFFVWSLLLQVVAMEDFNKSLRGKLLCQFGWSVYSIFLFVYLSYIPAAASHPILLSQSLYPICPPTPPNPLLFCFHLGKGRSPISNSKTLHIKLQ